MLYVDILEIQCYLYTIILDPSVKIIKGYTSSSFLSQFTFTPSYYSTKLERNSMSICENPPGVD